MRFHTISWVFALLILACCATGCLPISPTQARFQTSVTRAVTPTPGPLEPLLPITRGNAVKVRALRTLKLPDFVPVSSGQCNTTFSPDGRMILAACGKGPVAVWDVQSGEILFSLDTSPNQVMACVFNPSGDTIACGGVDQPVTFWDGATGEKKADFAWPDSPVWELEFSPDGYSLATCGLQDGVRLWDVASGIELWKNEESIECQSVSFDPEGTVIAFGTRSGKLGLIDVSTGILSRELLTAGNAIEDVSFDRTGALLAAGSKDDLVHLWRTANYAREFHLHGHYNSVNGVFFSPISSLLITSSHDGSTHIWDVDSEETLGIIGGHQGIILRGDFSPDGTIIATIGLEGTVRFWGVPGMSGEAPPNKQF